LLTIPFSAEMYCGRRLKRAAKYEVGVVSLFWLLRVSSIALRTTAVCCTLCSFGDERILSSLSLRDIGASTVILLYFREESLYQLA
jgi:hypothetical protein